VRVQGIMDAIYASSDAGGTLVKIQLP
jgi:hypothetical protein